MQTSKILLALAGIFLVACNALQTTMDISPETASVMKSIGSSMDTYMPAAFIRQAKRLRNTPVSLQLGDLFFHLDENTGIVLRNLRLPTLPSLTVENMVTDLKYLNSRVDLVASSVVFEAEYEVSNNNLVNILPLSSTGTVTVTFNNVQISGVVGLVLSENILQATNMDLTYQPSDVVIVLTYYEDGEKISSQVTVDSIDSSLVGKIGKEMRFRMDDIVRAQVNIILNQLFIDQLFLGSSKMVDEFRSHIARFTLNANSLIDQILIQADAALKNLGVDPISFPDIYESFSKKIFIVRWHGSFTANKGGINGLATLKRYKDVSLTVDGDVVTVFGGIGLEELTIGYSYYKAEFMGIGPTGTFRVGVVDPAIAIKVSVKLGLFTASLEDFSFDHTGQLKVDITGLDAIKWLLQKIGEWVSSALRDIMSGDVGKKIKDIIADIVSKFDPKPFFPSSM